MVFEIANEIEDPKIANMVYLILAKNFAELNVNNWAIKALRKVNLRHASLRNGDILGVSEISTLMHCMENDMNEFLRAELCE